MKEAERLSKLLGKAAEEGDCVDTNLAVLVKHGLSP